MFMSFNHMQIPEQELNVFIVAICYLLSFQNFYLAYVCFFSPKNLGRKIHHELDHVVGRILGIQKFSKIAGFLLLISAIGEFLASYNDYKINLLTVGSIQVGNIYYAYMTIYYKIIIRDVKYFSFYFSIITLNYIASLSIILTHFDFEHYGALLIILNASILFLCGFGNLILIKRYKSGKFDELIGRWTRILKFLSDNRDYVWLKGKDCPEGFCDDF